MSEYQYYEFQAIDRPLGDADLQALRALSSRARITTTSFVNSYEWGDFKGDPVKLMERWFDLHLYLANWGTRRLMIRLPSQLIDRKQLDGFLREVDCAGLKLSGENLVLDVVREEVEPEAWEEDWEDGSGRLAALAPLRADVLAGDLRIFYLLWLTAVEAGSFGPEEKEPRPGIGPLTSALEAFASFFNIDPDLVAAAAERSADALAATSPETDAISRTIAEMPEREKNGLLTRLVEGDPHVANSLRALVRERLTSETALPVAARTVGELRARADAIRQERERAEAERVAAEQDRKAKEAERARRARLDAIARRGEGVWREIDNEIERRNPSGYEKAIALLLDLRIIAEERGATEDFAGRLSAIRKRHAKKARFIERLKACG